MSWVSTTTDSAHLHGQCTPNCCWKRPNVEKLGDARSLFVTDTASAPVVLVAPALSLMSAAVTQIPQVQAITLRGRRQHCTVAVQVWRELVLKRKLSEAGTKPCEADVDIRNVAYQAKRKIDQA